MRWWEGLNCTWGRLPTVCVSDREERSYESDRGQRFCDENWGREEKAYFCFLLRYDWILTWKNIGFLLCRKLIPWDQRIVNVWLLAHIDFKSWIFGIKKAKPWSKQEMNECSTLSTALPKKASWRRISRQPRVALENSGWLRFCHGGIHPGAVLNVSSNPAMSGVTRGYCNTQYYFLCKSDIHSSCQTRGLLSNFGGKRLV